jgi:hypothetical protein
LDIGEREVDISAFWSAVLDSHSGFSFDSIDELLEGLDVACEDFLEKSLDRKTGERFACFWISGFRKFSSDISERRLLRPTARIAAYSLWPVVLSQPLAFSLGVSHAVLSIRSDAISLSRAIRAFNSLTFARVLSTNASDKWHDFWHGLARPARRGPNPFNSLE